MKRNTYRKNNKTGVGREAAVIRAAGFEHKAVGDHTVDDRHARHNRQGAVAADDTEGVSAAASSVSPAAASTASTAASTAPAVAQVKRTDLYDNRPLAFTKKNMTDLVIAYEAYQKLEQSITLLTDVIPDNPILEGLRNIDEIIMDISPVFDDMEDYDEYDTFEGILEDPMMSAEQKAEILMSWSSSGSSSSGSSPVATVLNHTVDDYTVDNCGTTEVKQDGTEDQDDQDNEENSGTSIPFTLEHMKLLLTAYDGYRELQDGLMDLLKMDPEEGVFHSISQLDNLFCKLSPIYDRTKNYQDQELGKVLLDDSSPLHSRAEKLMGW